MDRCPICTMDFEIFDENKNLFWCIGCGLYKTRKLPSKEYLKNHLRYFLLSACFDPNKFERRIEKALKQLYFIEQYITGGRVFDIGCGPAFFLRVAKERGWEVEGNDVSQACVEYAKKVFNINIYYKFIDDIHLKDEYYDLFNIWNALEHLLDPIETLKKVHKSLKSDGFVHIRVPNRNERTIEEKYEPDHTYEFNDLNLPLLLKNIGFQIVNKDKHDGELDLFCQKKER